MANPPCQIEECPDPATFIGTFFSDGSSITVCEAHFIDFAATMLEALTGVPVTLLITLPPETFAGADAHGVEDDESTIETDNVTAPPNTEEQPHEPGERPTTSPESSGVGTDDDRPKMVVVEPEYHERQGIFDEALGRRVHRR